MKKHGALLPFSFYFWVICFMFLFEIIAEALIYLSELI